MSKETKKTTEENVELETKVVVEKGYETKDGTKFPLFNDAANYARELGGEFVEPIEYNL